jgi:hypothetical protein
MNKTDFKYFKVSKNPFSNSELNLKCKTNFSSGYGYLSSIPSWSRCGLSFKDLYVEGWSSVKQNWDGGAFRGEGTSWEVLRSLWALPWKGIWISQSDFPLKNCYKSLSLTLESLFGFLSRNMFTCSYTYSVYLQSIMRYAAKKVTLIRDYTILFGILASKTVNNISLFSL